MNKEVFWFRNNMKLMQVSRRYRHGNTYLYLQASKENSLKYIVHSDGKF